jgi:hypothetical protein
MKATRRMIVAWRTPKALHDGFYALAGVLRTANERSRALTKAVEEAERGPDAAKRRSEIRAASRNRTRRGRS